MNKFEIWYKNQRVLRTIVQALIVLVPLANSAAAAVVAYLTEQTDVVIPAVVFVWLNVVIAATALIMGIVARIMAIPQINELLTLIGLGSVPAARLTGDEVGSFVLPDPKVVSREEFQKALVARGIQ